MKAVRPSLICYDAVSHRNDFGILHSCHVWSTGLEAVNMIIAAGRQELAGVATRNRTSCLSKLPEHDDALFSRRAEAKRLRDRQALAGE